MGEVRTASKTMKGVLCTVLGGMCWGFSGSCGQFLFATYGLDARWLTTVRMLSAGGDSGAGGHAEKQAGNEVGVAEKTRCCATDTVCNFGPCD